jgi:regulatory subunit for Cdc7p protein kinase
MATVTLHPSPHGLSNMTSSRVPLRDAPSAVLNSPLRPASTAIVGHKRPRQDLAEQRDALPQRPVAVSRPVPDRAVDQRVADFVRRHNKPTELQRKLEASRRNRPDARPVNHEQNRDDIIQWQNHYRKLFPSIKFYFEGIPKELANRLAVQVKSLGSVCSFVYYIYPFLD